MNTDKINSLIKLLNGGIEFYELAIKKVNDQAVHVTFKNMIQARKNAIVKLKPFLNSNGSEAETDSTWSIKAREAYAQLAGVLSTDKDHTYIAQLEEVEDKTLEEIQNIMKESAPACPYTSTLNEIHLEMKQCHDRMLALQKITA